MAEMSIISREKIPLSWAKNRLKITFYFSFHNFLHLFPFGENRHNIYIYIYAVCPQNPGFSHKNGQNKTPSSGGRGRHGGPGWGKWGVARRGHDPALRVLLQRRIPYPPEKHPSSNKSRFLLYHVIAKPVRELAVAIRILLGITDYHVGWCLHQPPRNDVARQESCAFPHRSFGKSAGASCADGQWPPLQILM